MVNEMLALIPKDPVMTVDRNTKGDPTRYCVDAKTEDVLQTQRLAIIAGSGLLIYGAFKLKGSLFLKAGAIALAAGNIYLHMNSYATVRKAKQKP